METGVLTVKQCDLGSMAEIRAFAAWLQQQRITIDLLVLNAAIKVLAVHSICAALLYWFWHPIIVCRSSGLRAS